MTAATVLDGCLATIALAGLLALAVAVRWVRDHLIVVSVQGSSMEPALHDGDRVLVRRTPLDRVRVGSMVVLGGPLPPVTAPAVPMSEEFRRRRPEMMARPRPTATPATGWIIKRARAVPGDPVPRDLPAFAAATELLVPPGKIVILGDNVASTDSRVHGYFDGGALVGVVVRRMEHRSWL